MATTSANSPPESKAYKAVHLMLVRNISSQFAQQKTLYSRTFTCPDDPQPASFKIKMEFKENNNCSVWLVPTNRAVRKNFLKATIYSDKMGFVKELTDNNMCLAEMDFGLGWKDFYSLGGVSLSTDFVLDWRVVCEIRYEGAPVVESRQCQCDSSQASNHMTLSQNMLTLLNDETEADVTLLVGGEKIKAHKNILIARSTYFGSLFTSGMTESLSSEIELDENPVIFKEALKFLYSSLTPENLDEIAIDLLPIADKYLLDELKQFFC